jgi:AcrR family transcriptional regulator
MPMTVSGRRNRADRAQLLAKSHRLQSIVKDLGAIMFKEGFLHLHTEELAHRLHCSKQTLYTLASSRDELFDLIVDRFLAGIRADAQKAAADASERVTALTGCLDAIKHAVGKVSVRFAEDLLESPQGQRRLREHEELLAAIIADLVSSGVQEGAFRAVHPRLTAEVLIRAVTRIVQPAFLSQSGLTLSQAFAELHKMYLHGLLRGEPADSGKEQSTGQNRPRVMSPIAFR